MKTTTTFNDEGKAMTETCEEIEMPADYSFAMVNDYVHTAERQYEELESLCLGMACEIDRLNAQITAPTADSYRIDWLADVNQSIGNVMLPMECVTNNLGSLRAAIDMAMRLDALSRKEAEEAAQ